MSENFWAQKGSIHWQSPSKVVELALKVFPQGIDLDPCAGINTDIAKNNWLLSDGDDALRDSWREGWLQRDEPVVRHSFWINPPFGTSYIKDGVCISAKQYKDMCEDTVTFSCNDVDGWVKQTIGQFADKVVSEVKAGMSGIWLSRGAMESTAIHKLLKIPGIIVCHPNSRINYSDPVTGKVKQGVNFNSVVLGFPGGEVSQNERFKADFISSFSKIGEIFVKA